MIKTTLDLPPELAKLHMQLSEANSLHSMELTREIEGLSEVLEHVRTLEPDHPAKITLSRIMPDAGFTGEKPTICGCCGRPL
jgi:hypothetical protein